MKKLVRESLYEKEDNNSSIEKLATQEIDSADKIENVLSDKEKKILKDLMNTNESLNENLNDIKNKLKKYGKKGLLTAGIILALAGSIQAQEGEDAAQEVTKAGIEYAQDSTKEDLRETMINAGLAEFASQKKMEFFKDSETDKAKAAGAIQIYHLNKRDDISKGEGVPKEKFGINLHKMQDKLYKEFQNMSWEKQLKLMNNGMKLDNPSTYSD